MARESRVETYDNRVEVAWLSLQADIRRWYEALPDDAAAMKHHLAQFQNFSQQAHAFLMADYDAGGWQSKDNRLSFRALVVGVLTSQWQLLRQVVSQRLSGSPYQKDLLRLDRQTADDYTRLCQALPENIRQHLSVSPPLIYLGRLAGLTLFSEQAPAVLSMPFGVLTDERVGQAIFHEIGHAVFDPLVGFQAELQQLVRPGLGKPSGKEKALQGVIGQWLSEIIADMVGTALAGLPFAESAVWLTASSEELIDRADQEHPPGLLRPLIHLVVLEYLAENSESFRQRYPVEAIVSFKKNYIEKVVGSLVNRRFQMANLTVVSLGQVGKALEAVVKKLLETPLASLDRQTLGQIFVQLHQPEIYESKAIPADKLPQWSEISEEQRRSFLLNLPDGFEFRLGAPGFVDKNYCCGTILAPLCC
ncbi:MAG: hypothetical protein HXY24_12320 [Rubrivivax sp.]|jgi:hypothetical protein|nr:hypothetical protein [Rubrivivax sp.]